MVIYTRFGDMDMRKSDYLKLIGVAAAAGTVLGMLTDRKHPAKGGLLGVTAGIVAASAGAGVYHYITSVRNIPYYSSESSLYEELDSI
jgi:hypothetical protein